MKMIDILPFLFIVFFISTGIFTILTEDYLSLAVLFVALMGAIVAICNFEINRSN